MRLRLLRPLERLTATGPMEQRFALAAAGLALAIFLLSWGIAFLTAVYQADEALNQELRTEAERLGSRHEINLDRLDAQLAATAANPLVANALLDSLGRETYLQPFLASLRPLAPDGRIWLLDFRGRPLASTHAAVLTPALDPEDLDRSLNHLKTSARLYRDGQNRVWLRLAYPVIYRLTGMAEGVLVLDAPLAALLPLPSRAEAETRLTGDSRLYYWLAPLAPAPERLITVQRPLRMPASLQGLDISVALGMSRLEAYGVPLRLTLGYGVAALLITLLVILLARQLARRLARPIRQLTEAAEQARAQGRLDAAIDYQGEDELGRLVDTFNGMMRNLRATHAAMEEEAQRRNQELHHRELALRAILDNFPFLIWQKDAQGRFVAVNRVFAESCGQAGPDALTGKTDLDIWPADLAAAYQADDRAVLESRAEKCIEEPIDIGGERRWFETYKKAIVDAGGEVIGTVGFSRDISDRREAQARLQASEERWALAVAGTNDGIYDWHTATGELYLSPRWKQLVGYDADELDVNMDQWLEHVHPDDVEAFKASLRQHLGGENDHFEQEYRFRHKDGGYRWLLGRGRALFNEDGHCTRMVGSTSDVTAQREARIALLDHMAQVDAIFSLSPDGFVTVGDGCLIKYANPAFYAMTGLEPGQLMDQPLATLYTRLRQHSLADIPDMAMNALLDGSAGAPPSLMLELNWPRRATLLVKGVSGDAPGVRHILYFRDITHEAEVDRMKSEFLSTAAHELRTPMSSILGFSELLLEIQYDEETRRDVLATIHEQSQRIVQIINELLDLARIESRRGKDFRLQPVSLAALARDSLKGMMLDPETWPVTLELDDTVQTRADPDKLRQAITNILSNAQKYSPEGGAIHLDLRRDRRRGQEFVGLRITDHGLGMTAEQLSRIFDRFWRADSSGSIPGTGLGMSIVKEIIELHGGEVDLESQPGEGTRVTLWLPAHAPTPPADTKAMP